MEKKEFYSNNETPCNDIEIKIQDDNKIQINRDNADNKFSYFKSNKMNNNFVKVKRKRAPQNKIIIYDNYSKINKKKKYKKIIINNEKFETIKSELLDYEPDFETIIKANSKKDFWKNLIFKKFGGQKKLLSEIINDIEKNENKIYKKKRKMKKKKKITKKIENDINLLKNNASKEENSEKNENELFFQNESTTPSKKNRSNIITIYLDDEDSINNIMTNQINDISYLTEEENILNQIKNIKGLENEYKFLKKFLYNENFFNENENFCPATFIQFEKKEINKEIIYMLAINLKFYSILKIIYPNLDYKIIQKNIQYLQYLAKSVDKFIENKYELIIEMIFGRLKKEAEKKNQKNNKSNNYFF